MILSWPWGLPWRRGNCRGRGDVDDETTMITTRMVLWWWWWNHDNNEVVVLMRPYGLLWLWRRNCAGRHGVMAVVIVVAVLWHCRDRTD